MSDNGNTVPSNPSSLPNPADINTLDDKIQVDRISAISSYYSNFAIERYARPKEINNCLTYANTDPNFKVGSAECACALSGMSWSNDIIKGHCVKGYNSAFQNKLTPTVESISWCAANVPSELNDPKDQTNFNSWLTGCLNGIKGEH